MKCRYCDANADTLCCDLAFCSRHAEEHEREEHQEEDTDA